MVNPTRDTQTGQFGFHDRWERICVCGHQLGTHTAEAPHECMNEDRNIPAPYAGTGEHCDCKKFRVPRRRST